MTTVFSVDSLTVGPGVSASADPVDPTHSGSVALCDRFLLTQVGQKTLVLPAAWVAEIVRIERTQVLKLPFYSSRIAGIVHYNGNLVPLFSTHRLFQEASALRDLFLMVRLSSAAGSLAHIGLILDSALGSKMRSELPPELFQGPQNLTDAAIVLLDPDWFPTDLWQPQGQWAATA
jgi:CheW-like domain